MSQPAARPTPVAFSPDLVPEDSLAAHWLRQVTLRLRREISWLWHERGLTPGPGTGTLPPTTDRTVESLELSRYADLKRRFFAEDETARYLSELIAAPAPNLDAHGRGSFGWVVRELALADSGAFLLALALAPALDHAMASVIAACLNDTCALEPNLALAQRLWDAPSETLELADPGYPLFTAGLIRWSGWGAGGTEALGWRDGLSIPTLVARHLMFPSTPLPPALSTIARKKHIQIPPSSNETVIARRLRHEPPDRLRVIPVIGGRGSDDYQTVARTSALARRDAVKLEIGSQSGGPSLASAATYCWLRDLDLYLDRNVASLPTGDPATQPARFPVTVPINLYMGFGDSAGRLSIPESSRLPSLPVPELGYEQRVELWRSELGPMAKPLEPGIADCARRFRFGGASIQSVARQLRGNGKRTGQEDLVAACRAEVELDMGDLAEQVRPRFTGADLVLPHKQAVQLDEIRNAMCSLRAVHYEWGTARAWDESGIAALFAGPPGTGKSMAAEVLASELDLPLYRIDLSQVVNKYIGETEKNLKKLFDACDACDLILLFDEADSLFGKRTEVRDAHDRYANLEVSYLLARMERAKGLTILSTNRKKDVDEAFLRRLRYIVDFPQPGIEERRKIWELNVPPKADGRGLDFDFLAEKFPLCGGHIRSAMFNASLQSAGRPSRGRGKAARKLRMEDVLVAVRRELDKANRTMSLDQFGAYRPVLEALETPEAEV